jgi:hypothetical protein
MNHNLTELNSPTAQPPELGRGSRKATLRLLDWLMGLPEVPPDPARDQVPRHEVIVEPPQLSTSWLQSFGAALTEATTTFIMQNVEPLYRDCDRTRFVVKRVKVGMKESASGCLQAVQKLPAAMRNTMALLRIQKAKGAAEQLVLDRFYGLSILAEETLVDDQLVETIVSYSGSRVLIRFQFEGEYILQPESPSKPAASQGDTAPSQDLQHAQDFDAADQDTGAQRESSTHGPSASFPSGGDTPMFQPKPAVDVTSSRDTPLYRPKPAAAPDASRDTPLYRPSRPVRTPALKLHLRAGAAITAVELFQDDFPYTVGRHPLKPGFCVRAINQSATESGSPGLLANTQTADSICYVSRDHLVLNAPDLVTGEIPVDNLAAQRGKNGTYVNGEAQPERFIHSLRTHQPLRLGAPNGEGILELVLERG